MSNPQSFSFLKLPPELRNRIYAYTLVTYDKRAFDREEKLILDHPKLSEWERYLQLRKLEDLRCWSPLSTNLSILLTNRQVHDEATKIFYSQNMFLIELDYNEDSCNFGLKWDKDRVFQRLLNDTYVTSFTRIQLRIIISCDYRAFYPYIRDSIQGNIETLALRSPLRELRANYRCHWDGWIGNKSLWHYFHVLDSLKLLRGVAEVYIREFLRDRSEGLQSYIMGKTDITDSEGKDLKYNWGTGKFETIDR
ncbi:hypothetical protein MMC12_002262 [Toensbergia leucococca]|nr:hypothetical protein [Toensbergia leucococca]